MLSLSCHRQVYHTPHEQITRDAASSGYHAAQRTIGCACRRRLDSQSQHRVASIMRDLTHGNTQEAHGYLDRPDGNECIADIALRYPVERIKGDDETEEVLEDEQAGKSLDRNLAWIVSTAQAAEGLRTRLTMGIDNVQRTGNGPHHHSHDHEPQENRRDDPPMGIRSNVIGDNAKAIQPSTAKNQLEEDQQNPKFGLVSSLVPFDHHASHQVG